MYCLCDGVYYVLCRDDPYCTMITDKGIDLVFNVYDIVTSYESATLSESVDCASAYYLANMLICQATNSTATHTFSSDGNTITSTCLNMRYLC